MKNYFTLTDEFVESATVDEQLAKRLEIHQILSEWLCADHGLLAKWMKENHIESLFILDDENKE